MMSRFHAYPVAALLVLLAPAAALAQTATGSIEGRVVAAETGATLPGVRITVQGSTLTAVSNSDGEFRLVAVPAGAARLSLDFVGVDSQTQDVAVTAGAVTRIAATLGALQMVNVVGQRGAQARALSEQRSADNIRNVVSADQAGRFPDLNVAESLRRVPGVSIEREEKGGDGRYVSIRGLDSGLNNFKINGMNVAQVEEETRRVPLDVVQTGTLSKIVVNKTLLPDADADGIGGSVSLETATAFDFPGRVVELDVSGFYNDFKGSIGPRVEGLFATRLGPEERFGVLVAGSWSERESLGYVFRNGAANWVPLRRNDPSSGFTLADFRINSFENQREDSALQFALDWQASGSTRLAFQGSYNELFDAEINRGQFFAGSTSYDAAGNLVTTGMGRVSLYGEYEETQFTQESYVLSGETSAGLWSLDYRVGFAKGGRDEPNDFEVRFDQTIGAPLNVYDLSDASFPQPRLLPGDPALIGNAANYVIGSNDIDADRARNERYAAQLDATFTPANAGSLQFLKFGVKAERSDRELLEANVFTLRGPLTLAQFGTGASFSPAESGAPYPAYLTLDVARLRDWRSYTQQLISTGAGTFRNNYVAADGAIPLDEDSYQANEDVYGAYVMGKYVWGDWELVGGLRLDHTRVESGNLELLRLNVGVPVLTPITTRTDYTNLLPRFQLNWRASDRVIARGAVFASIARPEFQYISAATEIVQAGNGLVDVRVGNPDLEPSFSWNYDLGIEYYFGRLAFVSANAFHKDISDFIFNERAPTATIAASPFLSDPRLAGRTINSVFRFTNGEAAKVTGIELAYVQQFSQLTSFWKGFGVYANLTAQRTEADLGIPGRTDTDFFNAPELIYTAGVTYQDFGFEGLLAYSYRDRYLRDIADFGRGWYAEPYGSLDAQLGYGFEAAGARYTLTLRAIDLLDDGSEPINDFRFGEGAPLIQETTYNGRSVTFGINVRF